MENETFFLLFFSSNFFDLGDADDRLLICAETGAVNPEICMHLERSGHG
jgi:hypothetical protein